MCGEICQIMMDIWYSRAYLLSPFVYKIQVPYELLNKKFRTIQKAFDREISQVSNAGGELSACVSSSSGASFQEVSGQLDGVAQRLSTLKRKAEECVEEELECTRLCKVRLDHIKSYASGE